MKLVILESPYAARDAKTPEEAHLEVERNLTYGRRAIRHSLGQGEAPIVSHLLYTQEGILDDNIPEERQWGIDAGLAWKTVSDYSVVYIDYGISRGMQYGIDAALEAGREVIYRRIGLNDANLYDKIEQNG